jgi:hypothetical protein
MPVPLRPATQRPVASAQQRQLIGQPPIQVFRAMPRVDAGRAALAARPTVCDAVDAAYPQLLKRLFIDRGTALSVLINA